MKAQLFAVLALGLVSASGAAAGTIVYDNTAPANDTGNTIFYSTGPYEQIGDALTLGGTDRTLTGASVQFYNNAAGGSFSAVLRFWNAGAPVGTQIGSDYQFNNLAIDSGSVATYSFDLPNLTVPQSLVATVAILNATAGMDLGLDLFDPPTVGSSDNSSLIVKDTSFYATTTPPGLGNLYLSLTATTLESTTPEPSTAAMMCGVLILAFISSRGRSSAARTSL